MTQSVNQSVNQAVNQAVNQLKSSERPTGLYELVIRKFVRNRVAVAGLICLALILLAVLFAEAVTPYDPIERNTPERNMGPSLAHPFGTDKLGRDIMSRVLYGGRVSLQVGFLSIALATVVSVPLGLIGGFVGGLLDDIIMRLMDLILAFPGLILAIWLVSLLGSDMRNVIIAIAFFSVPTYARLIRGITLSIREMEYVMAARSMGAGSPRIMFFHVLPGVLGPLVVLTTLGVSGAIVAGASLSFLGLGVSPPTPEWGAMLADGRNYMRTQWWIAVFPGVTITTVVLVMNIIGDALRDALDPNVRA